MTVDLVDHHRGSADKYSWMPPFDWSMAYENERWWDEVRHYVDDPWFVQVVGDGVEVARVELDDLGEHLPTRGTKKVAQPPPYQGDTGADTERAIRFIFVNTAPKE